MRDYMADDWRGILQANNLSGFDDWWALKAEWFEPANRRRGGWSGVSRVVLRDRIGNERGVFLKRQENHTLRTLRHPWRGIPTFAREMDNILALQAIGVAALEPVYFAERNDGGKQRAILVTEALDGFVPLDRMERAELSLGARKQLIRAVADVARGLHRHKFVHNCFYPKHLFARRGHDGFEVRVIDLEKARRKWRQDRAVIRDLDTLNRHSPGWTLADRRRFLKSYLGEADATRWRRLWRRLEARRRKKSAGATDCGAKMDEHVLSR